MEWSFALFFRGALDIFAFAFAFSACACLFLLTFGIVFEGNISATYNTLMLLVLKLGQNLSHLFITYLYDIAVAI
jgi:hypothetical protein